MLFTHLHIYNISDLLNNMYIGSKTKFMLSIDSTGSLGKLGSYRTIIKVIFPIFTFSRRINELYQYFSFFKFDRCRIFDDDFFPNSKLAK